MYYCDIYMYLYSFLLAKKYVLPLVKRCFHGVLLGKIPIRGFQQAQ